MSTEIQRFIDQFKKTFVYEMLSQTLTDEQLFSHSIKDDGVIWFKEQMRQMWAIWLAGKTVPEGFVLITKDQFESFNEFKELYKRAIFSARKRKGQLNWAHVASLGVGSCRAIELCRTLNIDPSATNMHESLED